MWIKILTIAASISIAVSAFLGGLAIKNSVAETRINTIEKQFDEHKNTDMEQYKELCRKIDELNDKASTIKTDIEVIKSKMEEVK